MKSNLLHYMCIGKPQYDYNFWVISYKFCSLEFQKPAVSCNSLKINIHLCKRKSIICSKFNFRETEFILYAKIYKTLTLGSLYFSGSVREGENDRTKAVLSNILKGKRFQRELEKMGDWLNRVPTESCDQIVTSE